MQQGDLALNNLSENYPFFLLGALIVCVTKFEKVTRKGKFYTAGQYRVLFEKGAIIL